MRVFVDTEARSRPGRELHTQWQGKADMNAFSHLGWRVRGVDGSRHDTPDRHRPQVTHLGIGKMSANR